MGIYNRVLEMKEAATAASKSLPQMGQFQQITPAKEGPVLLAKNICSIIGVSTQTRKGRSR